MASRSRISGSAVMSWLRTADDRPIPLRGWLWLALYVFGGMAVIRGCAPFPPQVAAPARSAR